jgi:uncharacterized membrane protein YgcG
MGWARFCVFALLSSSLTGCGTVVPNIAEPWDGARDIGEQREGDLTGKTTAMPISATAQIEFEIKKQIYCELKAAVQTVDWYSRNTGNVQLLPHDWGASVSISLQVDESTALNPGVALNVAMANATSTFGVVQKVGNTTITPPMTSTPQSFSLGFGATISSTATRIDKFDPYYSVQYLLTPSSVPKNPSNADPDPVCQFEKPTSDPVARGGHVPAKSSPLIAQDVFGVGPILANRALEELEPGAPHIVSQLGLVDWLVGATWTNQEIPSVGGPAIAYKFPEYLKQQRARLKALGFSDRQVTDIIASGASSDDLAELVDNPDKEKRYNKDDVSKFLLQGTAPSVLKQYKDAGYHRSEIIEMIMHCDRKAVSFVEGTDPASAAQHKDGANTLASAKNDKCSGAGGSSPGGGGGSSPGGGGGGTAPDTLTIEIKFIIVTNGNVTPTWKLLRVSANTTGSLLSLGRIRTHDVIITIGPNTQQTLNTHLASQIGTAVSNGNQAAALAGQ